MVKMYNTMTRRKSQAPTLLWWILCLCMLSTLASLSVVMRMMLLWNGDIAGFTARQQSISNSQYEIPSPFPKRPTSPFPRRTIPPEPRSFPRWGATPEDEAHLGLEFEPLLVFIVNSSQYAYAPSKTSRDDRYIATSDHGTAVGKWYPEVLYILDHEGLTVSDRHRSIIEKKGENTLDYKVTPMERQMRAAWQMWKSDPVASKEQWPRLSRVFSNEVGESSGFPFLVWHGDYTECSFQNWKQQYSIPLFTVAASVHCNYTFPFPNHLTIATVEIDWNAKMQQFQSQYPWEQKLPQIVWRGSLTGKMINATQRHPRWQMMQRLQEMKQQQEATDPKPFLFNVGATRLPRLHQQYEPFLHEVGGIVEPIEMEDFQKFRGIIDLDGNSWSSRFGELLCYNSVVLKVEPQWVDYFYYPVGQQNDRLQPWVHYIPVQSDLSDLVELAEFVVDPANDAVLKDMVTRANDWCRLHMVPRRVATDMLDIWERYVALLDIGDTGWSTRRWPAIKRRLLQPESPWRMNRSIDGTAPQR
jgi:Glycosyl transferase family 90